MEEDAPSLAGVVVSESMAMDFLTLAIEGGRDSDLEAVDGRSRRGGASNHGLASWDSNASFDVCARKESGECRTARCRRALWLGPDRPGPTVSSELHCARMAGCVAGNSAASDCDQV